MITVDNYQEKIKHIAVATLPQVLQEGHAFFIAAKDQYAFDPIIRETIGIYLKQLNTYMNSKPKQKSLPTTEEKELIQIFLKLNGQVQSKEQLEEFILSLQEAVKAKKISKSSPLAKHIEQIQQKLIRQYNSMKRKEKVRLAIAPSWLKKLKASVAKSQEEWKAPGSSNLAGFEVQGLEEVYLLEQKATVGTKCAQPKKNTLFASMEELDKVTQATDTFRIKGDLGKLLGNLERFELAITLEGDQGGGKTKVSYQLADAFAEEGHSVAIFSLEIGRNSDLIKRMRDGFIKQENRYKVMVADQLPEGFDTIKKSAKEFDVIIIDSWNKLDVHSSEFDKLRKAFPHTIFIVIFQRTTQGTIRGGTAPLYDAGINLEVVKVDDTFKNNYVVATKNRYGETGLKYNVVEQKLVDEPGKLLADF